MQVVVTSLWESTFFQVCGSPAFMAPEMVLRQGYDFKADGNIGFVEMWSFHSQRLLLADRHVEPWRHLLYGDAWDTPGPGSQYPCRSTLSIRSRYVIILCHTFEGWEAKDECECISDAMKHGSWTLL